MVLAGFLQEIAMPDAVASHMPPEVCPPAIELPSGVMRFHFMAWLPQGILGPKMANFVADQDAQVLEVDRDRIRLRIGRKSWRQGRSAGENFALELKLSLNHQTICARSSTHVVAELKPLVGNLPLDLLNLRFGRVARSLRYCLLAQELEAV
jgi:hypothetical protein